MNTPLASGLVDTLVVLALGIAVWALASIPIIWIKTALTAAGVYEFPARLARLAQTFGVDGSAFGKFFEHADHSMTRSGDSATVRVALDERHDELRNRLGRAEDSVRTMVNSVRGLAGQSDGTTFLQDFNALKERTRLVDRIGVELPDDIDHEYAQRARLRGDLFVLTPLTVVVALANGALLSVLFGEMTAMKVFGLPMSYLFGIVVVLLEVGIGMSLHQFRKNPLMMGVMIVLMLVATGFEAFAMSIFSVEFSTSLRDADPSDAALHDYWMVLLALVFTPMTSIFGYLTHKASSENDELKGRTQLSKELKDCNAFVEDLPKTWVQIEQKAQSAEAAIERYQDVLGGQGDRLSGAIDALVAERRELSQAILSARIEDWPNLVAGVTTDARQAAVQNIFSALALIAALVLYSGAVSYLVLLASGGLWSYGMAAAVGGATSILFVVVGYLAFNRLRLTQGQDGRALPMSAQPYHKAVAAVLALGCAAGLIWASANALGPWGIITGVFLTALGGALSFLGYHVERAARGIVLLASLFAALIVAIATAALGLLRYGVLWLIVAASWLLGFIVRIAAIPAELFISLFRKKDSQTQPALVADASPADVVL